MGEHGGEAVERAVRDALVARGRSPVVGEVRQLSGGASRQTWSVTVRERDEATPLIVQVVRPGSIDTGGGLDAEVQLLELAATAGVAAPSVVAHEPAGGALGRPFVVVEHVEGETIARRILRDGRWAAARSALVGQCADALARIHAIDLAAVPDLPHPDPVAQLRAVLRSFDAPYPTFELALRWLERHPPRVIAPAVLHGDFRLGNLIVDDEGLAAVIDWELAHIGDPMADLAWLSTRAWRFGAAPPVAGLGSYESLFVSYEEAGGAPVDVDAFRWWQVHSALRWGVICVIQVMAHLGGHSRSVELAAIGRRTAEQEWDILELLG